MGGEVLNARANHVGEGMVLLDDFEGGGVGDFGVFGDLDTVFFIFRFRKGRSTG